MLAFGFTLCGTPHSKTCILTTCLALSLVQRGSNGDWGQKANDVLRYTKGKSFKHEKTKKKRGSYCGGAISTGINSIRFDSD